MWSQGQSHGASLRARGEGRRSGAPGVSSPGAMEDNGGGRAAKGPCEISSVPPFHLPAGLHQPGGANKRRKLSLSLSASRRSKDAEELRSRNAQRLLAQSIESEDDGDQDDQANNKTNNSDDDHRPASGKPSLEDVEAYSPDFAPVHLGDSELVLSQAEEEAQDKAHAGRASQAGAATGWDSDDKWWYLAAEDIVQLSVAAPADGEPGSRPASGSQRRDHRQPAPISKEDVVPDPEPSDDEEAPSPLPPPRSFSPVIVPTGRVRMENSPTSGAATGGSPPSSSFFPASQPFPPNAPRPLLLSPNESPIRPISRSEVDRVLGPSDDEDDDGGRDGERRRNARSDEDEDDEGEGDGGEDRGSASSSTSASSMKQKGAFSVTARERRRVRAQRRALSGMDQRKTSALSSPSGGGKSAPASRKVSVIVEENGQMVEVIGSEGARVNRRSEKTTASVHGTSRLDQTQRRAPPGDDGDSQDDEVEEEDEAEGEHGDGDDEAADADADAAASYLESEKKATSATTTKTTTRTTTTRTLFDEDNDADNDEEEDDGGASRTWLRRRFKNPAAASRLSRSEFRELCRGKPASSPSMLTTTPMTTTSRGASGNPHMQKSDGDLDRRQRQPARSDRAHEDEERKESEDEDEDEDEDEAEEEEAKEKDKGGRVVGQASSRREQERERDDKPSLPPTTIPIGKAVSTEEKRGVVATSILPLAPVVVMAKQTTPKTEAARTPTKASATGGSNTRTEGSSPGQIRSNHASKAPPPAPSPLAMARPSQELSEEPLAHSSRAQRAKRQRETDERTTAAKPMLAGLHFILTGLNEERPDVDASTSVTTSPARLPPRVMQEAEVKELIEDLGGTVINRMAHLRQQDRLAGSRGFVWRSAWGDLPSVILISDKHHRTLKYLMALAAGIPTIHYRWLLHSTEQGCPLPYRPYLLPAGVSLIDEKRLFHHESWPMAVFAGVQIRLLGSRQFMKYWRLVLEEAGAEVDATEPAHDEGKAATTDGKKKGQRKQQQQHRQPKQTDKRTPPSLRCTVAEKESYLDVVGRPNKAASPRIAQRHQPQHDVTEAKQQQQENHEGYGKSGFDGDAAVKRVEPICTIEWVVQSLICRERLDFAAHPLFCYPSTSSTTETIQHQ